MATQLRIRQARAVRVNLTFEIQRRGERPQTRIPARMAKKLKNSVMPVAQFKSVNHLNHKGVGGSRSSPLAMMKTAIDPSRMHQRKADRRGANVRRSVPGCGSGRGRFDRKMRRPRRMRVARITKAR